MNDTHKEPTPQEVAAKAAYEAFWRRRLSSFTPWEERLEGTRTDWIAAAAAARLAGYRQGQEDMRAACAAKARSFVGVHCFINSDDTDHRPRELIVAAAIEALPITEGG